MCEDRFGFQQPHGAQAGLSMILLMSGRSILCIEEPLGLGNGERLLGGVGLLFSLFSDRHVNTSSKSNSSVTKVGPGAGYMISSSVSTNTGLAVGSTVGFPVGPGEWLCLLLPFW